MNYLLKRKPALGVRSSDPGAEWRCAEKLSGFAKALGLAMKPLRMQPSNVAGQLPQQLVLSGLRRSSKCSRDEAVDLSLGSISKTRRVHEDDPQLLGLSWRKLSSKAKVLNEEQFSALHCTQLLEQPDTRVCLRTTTSWQPQCSGRVLISQYGHRRGLTAMWIRADGCCDQYQTLSAIMAISSKASKWPFKDGQIKDSYRWKGYQVMKRSLENDGCACLRMCLVPDPSDSSQALLNTLDENAPTTWLLSRLSTA